MEYLTKNWNVSPWNYYKEVQEKTDFADTVEIYDTTLRDGEQAAGVQFSYKDKIAIGEKLMEAKVDRIEVCMPVVSEDDRRALSDLAKRKTGPSKLYTLSRANPKDIQISVDCGVDGTSIEIPASKLVYPSYGWTEQNAIDKAVESLTYAKSQGLETTLFLMDSSRSELPDLVNLIQKICERTEFDAIALVDTLGVLTPEAVKHGIAAMKDVIGDKRLEVHCHNDFGMAVANTVAGLSCGAKVAHTTMLGMGDRAGGAPTEEVVLALNALYGVHTNVDTTKFKALAAMVAQAAKVALPLNKAVVGPNIFTTESGIPVMIQRRTKAAGGSDVDTWPFIPQYVGFKGTKIALGKFSGEHSIRAYLDDMGISLNDEKVKTLTNNVKELSVEKGSLLTLDDFKDLITEIR